MTEHDERRKDEHHDPAQSRAGGLTDSDDTTQADAGMVGGTGAAPTEGTAQPLGTEPYENEEDTGRRGEDRGRGGDG